MNIKYWLKSKERLFMDFENFVLDWDDPEQNRIFIDRGSDVLLVAHIDTVLKPKFIRQRKTKSGKLKRIYAQGLDDRLGCMIAADLSEELNADLLLCDNEELCRSTGQFHKLKDYNWIAEFDRAGKDVVTYGLTCDDFDKALLKYWDIGFGSFSDICQLETKSCCVNVGIGYEFAHSKDSYVAVDTMKKQIAKFKLFYQEHKDTKFIKDDMSQSYSFDNYCELCYSDNDVRCVFGFKICRSCFEDMIEGSILNERIKTYGNERYI